MCVCMCVCVIYIYTHTDTTYLREKTYMCVCVCVCVCVHEDSGLSSVVVRGLEEVSEGGREARLVIDVYAGVTKDVDPKREKLQPARAAQASLVADQAELHQLTMGGGGGGSKRLCRTRDRGVEEGCRGAGSRELGVGNTPENR